MAKKRSFKSLVREADKLFSLAVRKRDGERFGGMCSLCGQGPIEQAAHLIHRGKYSVRWDEMNAYGQCRGCNLRHESWPDYYINWWVNRHGLEAYNALFLKSNKIAKYGRGDLEQIISGLKTQMGNK